MSSSKSKQLNKPLLELNPDDPDPDLIEVHSFFFFLLSRSILFFRLPFSYPHSSPPPFSSLSPFSDRRAKKAFHLKGGYQGLVGCRGMEDGFFHALGSWKYCCWDLCRGYLLGQSKLLHYFCEDWGRHAEFELCCHFVSCLSPYFDLDS